jgi:MoaA/NifB/PqqE/SkfB family radical SAM enzyme
VDVFFGGFGEPLAHPEILEMVKQAKQVARSVELITNGILLDERCSRSLIDLGLGKLWVSVDGATPENYADVRIGATLPLVLENITRFNILRDNSDTPEIGISFVAMRRNIADLPLLLRQASRLGVSHFMVTNVFPYTAEMCQEMLYTRSVDGVDSSPSPWVPRIDMPRIDLNEHTQEALLQVLRNRHNVNLNGASLGQERGRCPFIERASVSIGWQGDVSPCLALMHPYQTYLNGQPRKVQRCVYGNINAKSLLDIWKSKEYLDFRKRVVAFDFSPCTTCGGCSWSEANQEDCFANPFPTCGGCLWAQGVIQCP